MRFKTKHFVFGLAVLLYILLLGLVGIAEGESYQLKITEVAWSGTLASASDEWFELYNVSETPVNTDGWYLLVVMEDGDERRIDLPQAIVGINEHALFERTDDNAVASQQADGIYRGALPNSGVESLRLYAWDDVLADVIFMDEFEWPAGSSEPRASMQLMYTTGEWYTSSVSSDKDAAGSPILGTPGRLNEEPTVGSCEVIPYFDIDWELDSTVYEDHTVSFEVHVAVLLGDGTRATAELWWNTAAKAWWTRPMDEPEGAHITCIDEMQNIVDAIENILNRFPNGGGVVLPDDLVIWLNALHHFQSSNPFGAYLPAVISD